LFPPITPVSSTNKAERHDITEILLKVALNTITQNSPYVWEFYIGFFQLSKAENRNLNEDKDTLDKQFINNDAVWSILEFVVSNITGNTQWENCILLDFSFRGLSEPLNPRRKYAKEKVRGYKHIHALIYF
jgi:hypothetical protein